MSISSESSYESLIIFNQMWCAKLVSWLIIVAVVYHALAGLRHMHYDFADKHDLAGAKKTAWAMLIVTAALALMAACRIFL